MCLFILFSALTRHIIEAKMNMYIHTLYLSRHAAKNVISIEIFIVGPSKKFLHFRRMSRKRSISIFIFTVFPQLSAAGYIEQRL